MTGDGMTIYKPDMNPETRHGPLPWVIVIVGMVAMYGHGLFELISSTIGDDAQGHIAIIMGLCAWMVWRSRAEMASTEGANPKPTLGWLVFAAACVIYMAGRIFNIIQFEIGSLMLVSAAAVLLLRGPKHLKVIAFPLLFFAFAIPLPRALADSITQPMKMAVSYVAESIMYYAGYPVSRAGVTLQVGQYQLLVADACAGLHTLFTLEALGLLYLNLVKTASVARNVAMAVLIVPISFSANVVRVVVLCLVTYYLGDEAGQGFLHGFAGMVLFMTALILIISVDSLVRTGITVGHKIAGRA